MGRMGVVADIHPEARDAGDIGPARIRRKPQHLIVKLPGLFDLPPQSCQYECRDGVAPTL